MRNSFILAALAFVSSGCVSIDRYALRVTAAMLERGRKAALDEPDYQLGRDAVASQLKLIETMLVTEPENPILRRLAAEGFCGYAARRAVEQAEGLPPRDRDDPVGTAAGSPVERVGHIEAAHGAAARARRGRAQARSDVGLEPAQ